MHCACILYIHADHPVYIEANAGCKHFDVHGGPENIPVSRFSFDAKVQEKKRGTKNSHVIICCDRYQNEIGE